MPAPQAQRSLLPLRSPLSCVSRRRVSPANHVAPSKAQRPHFSRVSSPRLRVSAVNHEEHASLILSDPLLHANNWVLLPNNSGERLSAAIRNPE
jgi:hypothetical protein